MEIKVIDKNTFPQFQKLVREYLPDTEEEQLLFHFEKSPWSSIIPSTEMQSYRLQTETRDSLSLKKVSLLQRMVSLLERKLTMRSPILEDKKRYH